MIGIRLKNGLKGVEKKLRSSFAAVKKELDEHRDSIDQNTNEIQYNYEFLTRLDMKIEKLSERIDEISMMMRSLMPMEDAANEKFSPGTAISPLTTREKEVFFVIYASDSGAAASEIASHCGLDMGLVHSYLNNLLAKGIPVLKRFDGSVNRFYLEESFRDLQAKENIVGVSQTVVENVRM